MAAVVASAVAINYKMKRGHGRARGRSNEELYKNVNAARGGCSPGKDSSSTKSTSPTKRGSNLGASTAPSSPKKKASSGGLKLKSVEGPDDLHEVSLTRRGSAGLI